MKEKTNKQRSRKEKNAKEHCKIKKQTQAILWKRKEKHIIFYIEFTQYDHKTRNIKYQSLQHDII